MKAYNQRQPRCRECRAVHTFRMVGVVCDAMREKKKPSRNIDTVMVKRPVEERNRVEGVKRMRAFTSSS